MINERKKLIAVGILIVAISLLLFQIVEWNNRKSADIADRPILVTRDVSANDAVDSILEKMELGNIAFNVPESMNIDDSHQLQLLLSLMESVEQLKQAVMAEGAKSGATIKISDRMEARLIGHAFEITRITPEVQAVTRHETTQWKWLIRPLKAGRHELYLTLSAILDINGQAAPRVIKTFEKTIEVEVTTGQQFLSLFRDHWQWVLSGILIPVAGWFWVRKS